MSYLLLILVFIAPAFADLDKIQIKNLDLTYVYPEGAGEFEKLTIGVELHQTTYPVGIYRREKTFDIISPFVDFQWVNPLTFVHNAKAISTQKLNLNVAHKDHYAKGERLAFTFDQTGEFLLNNFNFACSGTSTKKDAIDRIKDDCLTNMTATVEKMELPFEFFNTLATQLPDVPAETEGDMPANDFSLTNANGDLYAQVRIKLILRATLRAWGHVQTEDNDKTLAIRVDEIKYGILPVTGLVMNELRRQVRHPDVTIDPPWIRIKMENK